MSINQERIQRQLDDVCVVVKDVTGSTNTDAKELYEKMNKPVLVVAEEQTAGRGRLDRKFFSPRGSGIYMSLSFNPDKYFDNIQLITPFAAVAVVQAIEKLCRVNCGIKWVNDVFINNKKVCGILTQINFKDGKCDFVTVGVGINVHKIKFPEELENIATSIENETEEIISRNDIISEFVNLFMNGDKAEEKLALYRKKSIILGRKIKVFYGEEVFDAVAESIDENANLVVRTENGIKTINAGEVSIRF